MSDFNFYLSQPHTCGYLVDQKATTLFIDPYAKLSASSYQNLTDMGFRRSGNLLYRPHCTACTACIPVRLNIHEFTLSRSFKRNFNRNADLAMKKNENGFTKNHFELYSRYLLSRHPQGGMDPKCTDTYHALLGEDWTSTALYEFFLHDKLLAIAITDQLPQGLSSVYTFYDPDYMTRGLGTFAILQQIKFCQKENLDWLYLGFWNPLSNKMSYKNRFQPLQYFYQSRWHACPPSIPLQSVEQKPLPEQTNNQSPLDDVLAQNS